MSIISIAVKHLIAAGVTGDALVTAIAEMEAEIDTRSVGAKRQARYRERLKDRNETSQTVTSYACDGAKEIPPNPHKKTIPLSPKGDLSPIAEPIEPDGDETADEQLRPEHVVEAWNDMALRLGLPKARLTPERRRKLATGIRKHGVEDWTEAISAIERSPFLRGQNDRSWRANFDFLLQPSSFTKLIEGTYDHG